MKQTFYSNGKLLITGEYLVLDGAIAFALPTKMGQNLVIKPATNKQIHWKSYDADGSVWFETNIAFDQISNPKLVAVESVENTLIAILYEAYLLNSDFITKSDGYQIETHLNFPKKWGLGTSSTLLNNVAQWTNCNAFALLNNSFGGSGYDIACAQNNNPITYQLTDTDPKVTSVSFQTNFAANIYFVYLNQKQSSKAAIKAYSKNKNNQLESNCAFINSLTLKALTATTSAEFAQTLEEHENYMSRILEQQTVKQKLFSDFNGTIKSLGAWGGDFVLVVSDENPTTYFKEKGYETILSYEEMILSF